VDGLLDTGSSLNLISLSSARTLLGLSQDEVKKGRKVSVVGLGGRNSFAFGLEVDLRLKATTSSIEEFVWRRVWVYAVEAQLPLAQMLIGQSGGFEGKVFVHINRPEKKYWIVRN
jgi:hypothetical protein